MKGPRSRLGGLALLFAWTLATPLVRANSAQEPAAPRVTVVERPSANGRLSHCLARPAGSVVFSELPPREILARLAWRFDVPLAIELRAIPALDGMGECSLDSRGADALETLRLAASLAGLGVTATDERVVVHRADEVWDASAPVAGIGPVSESSRSDVLVTGRVGDARGRAVSGAFVAGYGRPPSRSDARGRFACRVAAADSRVIAWMAGRAPSAEGSASGGEVDLTIGEPVASLVVQAVGSESGEAVADTLVAVTGLAEPRYSGATGLDGSFAGHFPRAGRATVLVSGRGHGAVRFDLAARLGTTSVARVTLPAMDLAARLRDETVTLEARDEAFGKAIWQLAQRAALPLRFSRALNTTTTSKRVSLDGANRPLGTVLRALCDAAKATTRIDEEAGLVWIDAP